MYQDPQQSHGSEGVIRLTVVVARENMITHFILEYIEDEVLEATASLNVYRQQLIGGSLQTPNQIDFDNICGLNETSPPLDVYTEKDWSYEIPVGVLACLRR